MPNGLSKLISIQKVLKLAINMAQNRTIWTLITLPNRHIACSFVMKERKKESRQSMIKIMFTRKMVFQKECE